MKNWLLGKRGGVCVFLVIALLVIGGLAWLTAAALRLEKKEHEATAAAELSNKMRLALWRLDSRVFPLLARESSRPYYHYSPTFNPPLAYRWTGTAWQQAQVLEPSPLLNEPLPDWILLHFQISEAGVWESPQVPSAGERQRLESSKTVWSLDNVTEARQQQFEQLKVRLPARDLLARVEQRSNSLLLSLGHQLNLQPGNQMLTNRFNNDVEMKQSQGAGAASQAPQPQTADGDFNTRTQQRAQLEPNYLGNTSQNKKLQDAGKGRPPMETVPVAQGLTTPLWMDCAAGEPLLLTARLVQVGDKFSCQGVLLDWPQLRQVLTDEVKDLFPQAVLRPVYEDVPLAPERTMTALPLEFDPAQDASTPDVDGWSPLAVGLAFVWGAALVALLAVGLGGWSLIDLSERRIRFVSAVTHELRTPLTTLRLYLDMLTGGMVTDEKRKTEYLLTLNAESERLNRLISNVLDFSRLENQRPRLEHAPVAVNELLEQIRSTWSERCKDAGKELVLDNLLPAGATVTTDGRLVQQIVGCLVENACKYSRDADDPHIWLRARLGTGQELVLEVEDRGPGVPLKERRLVFRPFRRGQSADPTSGGVGLGLALARRWARLLGGELVLQPAGKTAGACFMLTLPGNENPG